MSRWFWRFWTLVGAVALVLYLLWQGWGQFGPRPPQLSALRKQLADQIVPNLVEDLRKSKQGMQSLVMLHLANDPTDYLTDQMRSQIEQNGVFDLRDRMLDEKVQQALRLRIAAVRDLNAALSASRGLAQGVLFGTVHSFESYPGGARIDLEITLADVAGREVVFSRRYAKEISTGLLNAAAVQDEIRKTGGAQRLLGWVLAALLLPVFTIGFIRTMVRKESNRANAFALSVYTVVDAVLAGLLLGISLSSWPSVLLFLLATVAALAYNIFIMSFALKMET